MSIIEKIRTGIFGIASFLLLSSAVTATLYIRNSSSRAGGVES